MRARPVTVGVGLVALVALALVGAGGCEDGTSRDPGAAALLQVQGAQFVPGAMPEATDGPPVSSLGVSHSTVVAGSVGERVQGTLPETAGAVAIGLVGDQGYWILPAGLPSSDAPDELTFDARLAFAADFPLGATEVLFRAVDHEERFGPARPAAFAVTAAAAPQGQLVVSLSWDTDADLDLHVVDGNGVEIWSRNQNSYEPPAPGAPPGDPNAWTTGGLLDFDSNSRCAIDGRDQENVIWADAATPPAGHYTVRVDTFSLCGEASARWSVVAVRDGVVVGTAKGESLPAHTRLDHGGGAGVTALEFDLQ